MNEQLQQRLQSLKTEYESGQKMLTELETKQVNLRDTLLRISGAIQVLEELSQDLSDQNGAISDPSKAELDIPAVAEPV